MTALNTIPEATIAESEAKSVKRSTRKLDAKTRASVTAAVLEKLVTKKDFLNIVRSLGTEHYEQAALYDDANFTDEKLVDLCRFIALGLAETSAARAIGISPETLKKWKQDIPGVMEELMRARYLATGAVAAILRLFMLSENDAVALKATEFFLRTRSKEFREKQEVEVELDVTALQRSVRRDLYGRIEDVPVRPTAQLVASAATDRHQPAQRSGEEFEI